MPQLKVGDFLEKGTKKSETETSLDLWGRVDSNHRTDSRTDLQSVAIATMRLPQEIYERFVLV